MKLEIHHETAIFDALQTNWNALLKRSSNDIIFLTLEWQQTWWNAYHPGELYIILGRSDDGEVLGIAPWFIHEYDNKRIINTIGCVDVTDYLDLIVLPEYEDDFLEALAEHLTHNTPPFDKLILCNIPEYAALLEKWPPILAAHKFTASAEVQEVCPVINLPATWDDYLGNLNKKQRHELRRKIRRAGNQTDWYIVDASHDLQVESETFLELMAASNEEKAEFLQNEQNTAFFRAVVPLIMERGWLQLSFLTVAEQPAAAYLNFIYNNQVLVYNSGQDAAQFNQLSPGIVLLARNIRYAIEHEYAEFDFLRGNEPYKYQMGGQDTQVYQLTVTRA
ncbi:GNAT family N-acetyltransferase [Chloroflexota bacterium]